MTAAFGVIQAIPAVLMALLLLAGIVAMAVNRSAHEGAAVLGLMGCVLLLLALVFNVLLAFYLSAFVGATGLDFRTAIGAWNLVTFLFEGAGTGLLIWAVIAKRKPTQGTPNPYPNPYPNPNPNPYPNPGTTMNPPPHVGPGPQQPWPPHQG